MFVTLGGLSGDGTLGISVAAGTAVDASGNLASASGPSATVTVDNTPPMIAVVLRLRQASRPPARSLTP